ncbi:MAG: hypothetical protein HOP04_05810 [Methylophilaceae bacterium]|nr:hypothetical protein [Methylophilaceae bacterium]
MKINDKDTESLVIKLQELSSKVNLLVKETEDAGTALKLKYDEEVEALAAKQLATAETAKELDDTSNEVMELKRPPIRSDLPHD